MAFGLSEGDWRSARLLIVAARLVGHRCVQALLEAGACVAGLMHLDQQKMESTTAFCRFDDLISEYRLRDFCYVSANAESALEFARSVRPDIGIVIGVSQLLGEELLKIPKLGFIGMHPTLLPKGRGRAPIPWAIIKGLEETGVTLFWCNSNADDGDILAQERVPIYYEDVSATLGARTDELAIELLLANVPKIWAGTAARVKQDAQNVTIWPRRKPEDGLIDWTKGTRELYNFVRALSHPYPGAFTRVNGRRLWIWSARESLDSRIGEAGEVLARLPHGLLVGGGNGALLVNRIQWAEENEIWAADSDIEIGAHFGC